MGKEVVSQSLVGAGALGIIRAERTDGLLRIVRALQEGGLDCLEITMTTPGALKAIEEVAGNLNGVLMGAGTLLDAPTARQAILAGAQFLVTPTVETDVIEMGRRYSIPVIVGAMTPTEILTAWEAGADMVKIFPAHILGSAYLKAVRWHEDIYAVSDALGLCAFATTAAYGIDEQLAAELFSAATGIEMDATDIIRAGRRIVTLERCFNIREGYSEDRLPWRIMHESQKDLSPGEPISQEKLERMLREYYRLHGWSDTGRPQQEILRSLGLDFVLEETL